MAIPKRYIQPDSWPHLFHPTGRTNEGEWGTTWTESACRHCGEIYWVGRDSKPTGACPARTDKSEARRLGVD